MCLVKKKIKQEIISCVFFQRQFKFVFQQNIIHHEHLNSWSIKYEPWNKANNMNHALSTCFDEHLLVCALAVLCTLHIVMLDSSKDTNLLTLSWKGMHWNRLRISLNWRLVNLENMQKPRKAGQWGLILDLVTGSVPSLTMVTGTPMFFLNLPVCLLALAQKKYTRRSL